MDWFTFLSGAVAGFAGGFTLKSVISVRVDGTRSGRSETVVEPKPTQRILLTTLQHMFEFRRAPITGAMLGPDKAGGMEVLMLKKDRRASLVAALGVVFLFSLA